MNLSLSLYTTRFHLKLRSVNDLEQQAQMSDKDLQFHLNMHDLQDIGDERKRIDRLLKRDPDEYFLWDVFSKKEDKVVGNLGFHNVQMPHKKSEIGYWCHPDYRRQNIISECLMEILKYGF